MLIPDHRYRRIKFNLSQEVKTSIIAIKGFSEILLTGALPRLTEQQGQVIQAIHSNTNRMNAIINEFRDAATLGPSKFSVHPNPIAPNTFIDEAVEATGKFFEDKSQIVDIDMPDDLPYIMGDHARLVQVMVNLLTNANKFTHAGGHIKIVAQLTGDFMQLSIHDNGIGMSKDRRQALFDDKYSIKDEYIPKLGMILTYNIVKQHGGEIWAGSELGNGTTIHFTVPIASDDISEI